MIDCDSIFKVERTMPKTVGAESSQSVSVSPTEEEEFFDYEFYFSVFAKTEFFIRIDRCQRCLKNSNSAGGRV